MHRQYSTPSNGFLQQTLAGSAIALSEPAHETLDGRHPRLKPRSRVVHDHEVGMVARLECIKVQVTGTDRKLVRKVLAGILEPH